MPLLSGKCGVRCRNVAAARYVETVSVETDSSATISCKAGTQLMDIGSTSRGAYLMLLNNNRAGVEFGGWTDTASDGSYPIQVPPLEALAILVHATQTILKHCNKLVTAESLMMYLISCMQLVSGFLLQIALMSHFCNSRGFGSCQYKQPVNSKQDPHCKTPVLQSLHA
eukprot:5730914-Amphidinium_carterae.5